MSENGIDNVVTVGAGKVGYEAPDGNVIVKFGWNELKKIGAQLCAIIGRTKALILRYFGDNNLIVALLELIEVLCPLIQNVADSASAGTLGDLPDNTLQQLVIDLQAFVTKWGE